MKRVFSPDVILCGWLSSKHQLTNELIDSQRCVYERDGTSLAQIFCESLHLFMCLKTKQITRLFIYFTLFTRLLTCMQAKSSQGCLPSKDTHGC